MEIGKCLIYWREQKNMSIYRLSILSEVSEGHIRNIENGKKQPKITLLKSLTDSLGITLSEFFNIENNDIVYATDEERRLLECYRSLSANKAAILLEFYERMIMKD